MINVALIGLGRIGQMHAENLLKHKSFNLRYIYDIDKKIIHKLSNVYNCNGIKDPSTAFKDKMILVLLSQAVILKVIPFWYYVQKQCFKK